MIKALSSLVVLTGLMTSPVSAQPCFLGLSHWNETLNLRAAPGGPIVGELYPDTPVHVRQLYINPEGARWVYVVSEWGEGWIWARVIEPSCIPPCGVIYCGAPPPPPCNGGCGEYREYHYVPAPRHYAEPYGGGHEKGQYQEPREPREETLPEAPMPNNQDYKPRYPG
jgi:hypothetical protein